MLDEFCVKMFKAGLIQPYCPTQQHTPHVPAVLDLAQGIPIQ